MRTGEILQNATSVLRNVTTGLWELILGDHLAGHDGERPTGFVHSLIAASLKGSQLTGEPQRETLHEWLLTEITLNYTFKKTTASQDST